MRRSAGFGLNLPSLTPIPSHFLEHVRMRTQFYGGGIKLIDGVPTANSSVLLSEWEAEPG
jgi:hypothetical protein